MYLHERKVITDNPIASIPSSKAPTNHLQGPYTDEQLAAIIAAASKADKRTQRFLDLLLNTGCDLIDAVLHQPGRIKDETIVGRTVPVYRYKRHKTDVDAIVILAPDVAKRLRDIPLVQHCSSGMPFRDSSNKLRSDLQVWSRKLRKCIVAAGVKTVLLPGLDDSGKQRTKPANIKQFRHSFAVKQLVTGYRPELVAKMLGHVDTEMLRRNYAPWVEALDHAYLREVLEIEQTIT